MGDRARAVEAFKIGEQHAKVNPTQAFNNFMSAAYIDPTWGQAHYQVGNNLMDLQKHYAAIAAYRRALECKNEPLEEARIYANLGYALSTIGDLDESLEASTKATELDPLLPMPWANLSLVYQLLNRTEMAVSCAMKSHELDKDDPAYEVQLAFALMHNRQFADGLKYFEARFPYKLTKYLSMPFTKWRGERNKIVYVAADQGLGDSLSFARFVPEAARRCKHLFLGVQPEMISVLEWALTKHDNITIQPMGQNFPGYDHWTTFVSLPWAMGLSNEEIINCPHIDPRIGSGSRHWRVPDRALHIGIAWAGSELNLINHHRSIPLPLFLELQRCPGVQLYSLQMDDKKKELGDWGVTPVVRDLSGYITSVADTVGIMKNLDLVVSCESACAHIAALADVECWIPYSLLGKDFRIGITGEQAIWAPKTKYFLQERRGEWGDVFAKMVTALRGRLGQVDEQRGAISPRELARTSALGG